MRMFPNLTRQFLPYDADNRGHQLSFDGEKVWQIDGKPCRGHLNFVVLPPRNPFTDILAHLGSTPIDVWVSSSLHHDNLAVGEPVYFAGTVDFGVDGKVTRWTNVSGHYRPPLLYYIQAPKGFHLEFFE